MRLARFGPVDSRRALIVTAVVVAILKCIEVAIDSQVLLHYDSATYIRNGIGLEFNPTRSYVYGWLVGIVSLPFHSLRAMIAAQAVMGGLTAWVLAYTLMRFFCIRYWLAMGAAIVFALDPVQISLEHFILPEATAMLATAIFFVFALNYLDNPRLLLLIGLSLVGTGLVSLRIVYIPVVLAMAFIIPILAWVSIPAKWRHVAYVGLALVVSCGSTLAFHAGYRYGTGLLAHREPAYEYYSGLFLLATTSPIVRASDTSDARVARIVESQNHTRYPLTFDVRVNQLWSAEGLVTRLLNGFAGDERAANSAAESLARNAISRDPLGFLKLGWQTYAGYFSGLAGLGGHLEWILKTNMVHTFDTVTLSRVFVEYASKANNQSSLSLRYLLVARWWHEFLLASPYLLGTALLLQPANSRGVALLLIWNCLLLTATCFGAVESDVRYLQPFSFTSLAGAAVACEAIARKRRQTVNRESDLSASSIVSVNSRSVSRPPNFSK